MMPKYLENNCNFQTERLSIVSYLNHIKSPINKDNLTTQVIEIISPKVTELLPSGWQDIDTAIAADKWLKQIDIVCSFLLVKFESTNEVNGFIFLYEPDDKQPPFV